MRWMLVSVALIASACRGNAAEMPEDANNHDAPVSLPPADGATLDELRFAVVGDTRPANIDDTANYPTEIITKIWQDIEAESPHPQFVVSTGDYIFASTNGNEQTPQLAKYMAARAAYTGPQYPVMGNHECTGATRSNCGPGAVDGVTSNMTAYISTMLGPIGVTEPYYSQYFAAKDGSWTAKLVVVACNAWNTTQADWLSAELAKGTTYTFVARHEGTSTMSQTPCAQSQTIIDGHPLTLLVVGHSHTYAHYKSDKEIVVGNGGAPLTTGHNYGYVIVERNASGTLTVTSYDYMTHAAVDTFSITASGDPG